MSHGMLWYHVSSSFDNTPLTSICCVSPFMPDFADFVNVALLLGLGGRTGRAATRNLNNFWAGEQRNVYSTNISSRMLSRSIWTQMSLCLIFSIVCQALGYYNSGRVIRSTLHLDDFQCHWMEIRQGDYWQVEATIFGHSTCFDSKNYYSTAYNMRPRGVEK